MFQLRRTAAFCIVLGQGYALYAQLLGQIE
jgi:hypothetical protein